MLWVVLANSDQKKEFLARGIGDTVKIEWAGKVEEFLNHANADAFFDLLFNPGEARIKLLSQLLPKPVIINSVVNRVAGFPFIHINGWNTFLQREIIEGDCSDEKTRLVAEKIFSALNRNTRWVAGIAGFISPRVIAAIINEAYYALEENVSTKEEIDTAMKLGANYPYGPFEWAQKIGLENIYDLLATLSITEKRYQPSGLLKKEALR
jgi:3-hydroxybutyryl-CoA dehydrogenase